MTLNPTDHPYDPERYSPDRLAEWLRVAQRQGAKDRILIPRLARQFKPGRILELGAGAGQITQLLRSLGHDVLASDFAPFFVEHIRSLGIPSVRIDATDIASAGVGRFPNIFSQSISPFITTDESVILRAYRSCVEALEPDGRFVMIHAMAPRSQLVETMRRHHALAIESGLKSVVVRREQLLPSKAYVSPYTPVAVLLERMGGGMLGSRFTLVGRAPG